MAQRRNATATSKTRIVAYGLSALALGGVMIVGLSGLASASPAADETTIGEDQFHGEGDNSPLGQLAARVRSMRLPSVSTLQNLPIGISASALALRSAVEAFGNADAASREDRARDIVSAARDTSSAIRGAQDHHGGGHEPMADPGDQDRNFLAQLACLDTIARVSDRCLLFTPPILSANCGVNFLVGLGTCATF